MTTTAHGIALHEAPLYEAELPRTGYRPAVDYLADALQGQGRAIAKHVDAHLTNERVLDLAAAVNRAIAVAVRRQLEEAAAAVLALQAEVLDEVDTELPPELPADLVDVFDPRAEIHYSCTWPDCDERFLVDNADPMVAHGAYLDHIAAHDQAEDECEAVEHG